MIISSISGKSSKYTTLSNISKRSEIQEEIEEAAQSIFQAMPEKERVQPKKPGIFSWFWGSKQEKVEERPKKEERKKRDPDELSHTEKPQILVEAAPSKQTAAKTDKAKQGWIEWAKGKIDVRGYVAGVNKKETQIAQYEREMLQNLKDPQFIEFYSLLKRLIIPKIMPGIVAHLGKLENWGSDVIADFIEVNVFAHGFANLSRQVKDYRGSHPELASQPSLAIICAIFCEKASGHISMAKLSEIENKYTLSRNKIIPLIKKLFPQEGTHLQVQKDIQEYIQKTSSITNQGQAEKARKVFLTKLFPNYEDLEEAQKRDIGWLFSYISNLRQRHLELTKIFTEVSQDLLSCLFPNQMQDTQMPLFMQPIVKLFFPYAESALSSFMLDNYNPLEIDEARHIAWKEDLQKRVIRSNQDDQPIDISAMYMAPASFLIAYVKKFIQAGPQAVNLTAQVIDSFVQEKPSMTEESDIAAVRTKLIDYLKTQVPFSELEFLLIPIHHVDNVEELIKGRLNSLSLEQLQLLYRLPTEELQRLFKIDDDATFLQQIQQKMIIPQLAHGPLANWIVGSIQAMLSTENPALLGVGGFLKAICHQLTLAFLAEGAKLTTDGVGKHQFITELSDHIVKIFNGDQGQRLFSEEALTTFILGLPLPSILKEKVLLPLVIEKSKAAQEGIKKAKADLITLRKIDEDSQKTIRGYEGGEQLLSIIEAITDQIVDQVVDKNIDLISTLGGGDALEELCSQYLPGIKINDQLKQWLKDNICALGANEARRSAQSVTFLKQGIQAVLRKAIVATIETNFKGDGKDYAAQLLKSLHEAFTKAFKDLSEAQIFEIYHALNNLNQIRAKNAAIQQLKQEPAKPQNITLTQLKLLEDKIATAARHRRASESHLDLIAKRDALLRRLNANYVIPVWNSEKLIKVSEALVRQKFDASALFNPLRTIAIQNRFKALRDKEVLLDGEREEFTDCQSIIAVLDLSTEKLQLFSEAYQLNLAIQNDEKFLNHLSLELTKSNKAIEDFVLEDGDSREGWDNGKAWMNQKIERQKNIDQLSKEVSKLEEELDGLLQPFQALSNELIALLGLNDKKALNLPSFLQDSIWPLIESAKQHTLPRILFEQGISLFLPVLDMENTRKELDDLAAGNAFLPRMAHLASQEIIRHVPHFVNSYQPFYPQIFSALGVQNPTPENLKQLERAFKQKMIQLGREQTLGSLDLIVKGVVSKENERALLRSVETMISQWGDVEWTQEDFVALLQPYFKEEKKLLKQVQILSHRLHEFLFNRGKEALEPKHVLEVYQSNIGGPHLALNPVQSQALLAVIEKIKQVMITPEEIAETINDVIPGATDLHRLIAPQLKAWIVGDGETFKQNREFMQKHVEAILMGFFVKIGHSNQAAGQDILDIIAQKLHDLPSKALTGDTSEIARKMIDEVMNSVLGVGSEADLEGIPSALQKIVYDKIKEQAYLQLSPFMVVIIEREKNRGILKSSSGSQFLGDLCKALSSDIFSILPSAVNSYRSIGIQIFSFLSKRNPTAAEADAFGMEIASLVEQSKQKSVTHKALVKAYAKIAKIDLTDTLRKNLREQLDNIQAKDKIRSVVITPETIASSVSQQIPFLHSIQQLIANQIQGLLHDNTKTYLKGTEFVRSYLEGILLNVFIRIAKKNPPKDGKDTLIILTEKLLDVVATNYQRLKEGQSVEDFAKDLNQAVLKDILGIDSPEAFTDVPGPLKGVIYDLIKHQLEELIIQVHRNIHPFESGQAMVVEAQEKSKLSTKASVPQKDRDRIQMGFTQVISEDLAQIIMDGVPYVLAEMGKEKPRGVNYISKSIEQMLEDYARGKLSIAQVLLTYGKTPNLQRMLGENLTKLADKEQFSGDKDKAVQFIGNIILIYLNRTTDKIVQFENTRGKDFNQKLMANLLTVAAEHLRNINQAQERAKQAGRKEIRHAEYIEVASQARNLHPGVPNKAVNYEKFIGMLKQKLFGENPFPEEELRKAISKLAQDEASGKQVMNFEQIYEIIENAYKKAAKKDALTEPERAALRERFHPEKHFNLRDFIREERDAPSNQREKNFYRHAIKSLMKLLFPNGQQDLTFLPEGLRGPVWKIFKKNLFQMVIPMVLEILMDNDVIQTIVLSSLENLRDNLKQEIVLGQKEQESPLDALDDAGGALIAEVLKRIELPTWVQSSFVNKNGEISPAIKRALGSTLRKQFNENFLKEKLNDVLNLMAKRSPDGSHMLQMNTSDSRTLKAQAQIENTKKMQKNLKKVSRECLDATVSYFIRSTWMQAQADFDRLIHKIFGRVGTTLKAGLDAVFRLIFFKIVGTLLSYLISPIEEWLKEKLYQLISLDNRRDALLGMVTQKPADQPQVDNHVVYNENLIFNLLNMLIKTIEQSLDKTPIQSMIQPHPVVT